MDHCRRAIRRAVIAGAVAIAAAVSAAAGAAAATPTACARPAAGSLAAASPALHSHDGRLSVALGYISSVDADKRTLYCFVTPDGIESPTFHVSPGDTLDITLTNALPPGMPKMDMAVDAKVCGDAAMDASSVNMHFHGANVAPTCHSDEVIHTLVNSGQTFHYIVKISPNEPPGLYWYHPHVHGMSEAALLGGASGALIVDGLQTVQPVVAGLPERVLLIRDQIAKTRKTPGGRVPSWDLSLNYVPVSFPEETPAVIDIKPGRRELWRVANASADSILDLHLTYDGVDQPLEVVGLDGVPTGSQDGTGPGKVVWRRHILIPTGGRAEFVITGPDKTIAQAVLRTSRVDTGPAGDNDPPRTLAVLAAPATPDQATAPLPALPAAGGRPAAGLFESLDNAKITATRTLYFSEVFEGARAPPGTVAPDGTPTAPRPAFRAAGADGVRPHEDDPFQFYITEVGHKPKLFSPDNPPAITTTQGSVEAWTIENRTEEVHEFHIHQIHFKLIKRDGVLLPPSQQQYLDVAQVPYWTGRGPKPSITVLMDFRGHVTGDFVYHCHILEHEDGGMMAIIRVLPKAGGG